MSDELGYRACSTLLPSAGGPKLSDELGYRVCSVFDRAVLPDPKDHPTCLLQQAGVLGVPFGIARQLRPPIVRIWPSRQSTVLGTPMPKTPVNKDSESDRWEHNVRPRWSGPRPLQSGNPCEIEDRDHAGLNGEPALDASQHVGACPDDPEEWEFFVVPTARIDHVCGRQASITLTSISGSLDPGRCRVAGLRAAIFQSASR